MKFSATYILFFSHKEVFFFWRYSAQSLQLLRLVYIHTFLVQLCKESRTLYIKYTYIKYPFKNTFNYLVYTCAFGVLTYVEYARRTCIYTMWVQYIFFMCVLNTVCEFLVYISCIRIHSSCVLRIYINCIHISIQCVYIYVHCIYIYIYCYTCTYIAHTYAF